MKKNEELLHSIGDIDEKYIENAKPKNIQKKKVVWISALSAAACLVGTIGLMYYFMVRPLNDINNPGNSSEVITTEVTETSEPPHTEKTEYESEYPDVKEIDIKNIREKIGIDINKQDCWISAVKSSGGNIFIEDSYYSNYKNKYLCAEILPLGKKIVFPEINGIAGDIGSSDACFNDSYLYILLHRTLFSVSLETDEIIAQMDDMDSSSECLGVDNDGNVYMESGECKIIVSDGFADKEYVHKIIKYSPELELISEYQTSNHIPFEHIINFDDMYIDDNDILCCVYNNDKTVRINLSDETISSDEDIIKDEAYWYINNNDEKPLKTYNSSYIEDNSEEVSRWRDGRINCIDSEVDLSVDVGKEEPTSFIKLDESGEYIQKYSMPEGYDPIGFGFNFNKNDDIISAFSYESDGTLTYKIVKHNMISDNSDIQNIAENNYLINYGLFVINDFSTDNADNYYFSYMLTDKLLADPSADYPLITRYSGNNPDEQVTVKINKDDTEYLYFCDTQILIKDNVPYVIAISDTGKNSIVFKPEFDDNTYIRGDEIPGKLFAQSDGTLLYTLDDILYSYQLEDGKKTEICKLPQEVLRSEDYNNDIKKINEKCYAYINGSGPHDEIRLYLLTIK